MLYAKLPAAEVAVVEVVGVFVAVPQAPAFAGFTPIGNATPCMPRPTTPLLLLLLLLLLTLLLLLLLAAFAAAGCAHTLDALPLAFTFVAAVVLLLTVAVVLVLLLLVALLADARLTGTIAAVLLL
jgi:hypothetical protein